MQGRQVAPAMILSKASRSGMPLFREDGGGGDEVHEGAKLHQHGYLHPHGEALLESQLPVQHHDQRLAPGKVLDLFALGLEPDASEGDVLLARSEEASFLGELHEEKWGDEAGDDGDDAFNDELRTHISNRSLTFEEAATGRTIQRHPSLYIDPGPPTLMSDRAYANIGPKPEASREAM